MNFNNHLVVQIKADDAKLNSAMDALLRAEGISRDKNLEYSAGIFDSEMNIVATGSVFGNTLRCVAVDSSHRGEGLMNALVSHLIEYQAQNGRFHLFVYTKPDTAKFFAGIGFYRIATVAGELVFMENRRTGFEHYIKRLKDDTKAQLPTLPESCKNMASAGAVIMNANPFSLGHLKLVQTACASSSVLHLFVVSEDVSAIPFDVRYELVKKCTLQFTNIVYHKTGDYLISNATFPSYFIKDADAAVCSHAALDAAIFAKIAKTLDICVRYMGDEPFSATTAIYNSRTKSLLESEGLQCVIIPRAEYDGRPISASDIRGLLKSRGVSAIKGLVPDYVYKYFSSPQAIPVINRIRGCDTTAHH